MDAIDDLGVVVESTHVGLGPCKLEAHGAGEAVLLCGGSVSLAVSHIATEHHDLQGPGCGRSR